MMKVTLTGASSASATVDRTTEMGVTDRALRNKATMAPNMYRQRPTFVIFSSLHRPRKFDCRSTELVGDRADISAPPGSNPRTIGFLVFEVYCSISQLRTNARRFK